MTNRELLDKCIERSGLKLGCIAHAIGITRSTFRLKRTGRQDFTETEMRALARTLCLSEEECIAIFFAG